MEEYLKIKINLKISGPINFSRKLVVDYEKLKNVIFITNGSIYGFIEDLNIVIDRFTKALRSFKYYDFNIDYKQDK